MTYREREAEAKYDEYISSGDSVIDAVTALMVEYPEISDEFWEQLIQGEI